MDTYSRARPLKPLWLCDAHTGVGKAADHPPALVILSLNAEKKGAKSIVWVGKGIVYDTGGLSIKTKTGMPGRSWTH